MKEKQTIYADYQASTPVDPQVLNRMLPFFRESFGNPHSSDHIVGWKAAEAVSQAATTVAALVGADQDELVFTSGATEANNLALWGIARRAPKDRNRILVSAIEHKCVLAAAQALTQQGFTVEIIPVDEAGFIDIEVLQDMLDERVLLASVMAVNNEIGTIQDLPAISAILRKWGVLFHCDAAQAPCAMELTGLADHADFVSLSGHKMYAPQGIGALFIRRHLQSNIEPTIYGGGQQKGLRSGTMPVALCVGIAAAAEIILKKGAVERQIIRAQRDRFLTTLKNSSIETIINGPINSWRHPGNSNLRFDRYQAQDILSTLQPAVAASTGAACTSGTPEPSHVLKAIGLTTEQANASIRFSFGRFTNEEDVVDAAYLTISAVEKMSKS